jgi:hypothetical protein
MALFTSARTLRRRAEFLSSQAFVVLAISVAKDNEKTAASAEQFFQALHGIYRDDPVVQEHVALEIVAAKDSIVFYVFTPVHLRDFIEGQLYAQYPDLQITQVPDYARAISLEGKHIAGASVGLTKADVVPIKTYTASEIDPLASLSAVMANLDPGEHIWFQIVVKPVGDEWQKRGVSFAKQVRSGEKPLSTPSKVGRLGVRLFMELASPGSGIGSATPKEPPKLSAPDEAALKGIEGKITKLGFESHFRIMAICESNERARSRIEGVLAALKQYNTTNMNGFQGKSILFDDQPFWNKYLSRNSEDKGSVLNTEELASLFHFPSKTVETSAISWAGSKKGEAPFNLPLKDEVAADDLTVLGRTDFRNKSKDFGIKMDDRMRHLYVIGKSGTGKSTLLENMLIDDVLEGRGVIVVDPHGELADKVLDAIPEHRVKDVVLFDPADREFPIAFNLLEQVGDDFKGIVASGFVGILKKIFGNSWGPRLEYVLRNTALALLDAPNATMLGIPRMLTEPGFRNQIIEHVHDPVIRDFWVNEWSRMDQKQQVETMSPILNKVGQFLATSTIRNIVGQPKSSFDVRQIMDEKKILIVNLSKGKIGEDNSALLGAMIITKVQLAAMSRANVSPKERPACFLYVDEFQNFATESFATILSEARKYNLGLTVAHQYIKQMSEEVRDAVFGNVGTIVSFRVGADDASLLQKEFAPVFDENDLVNLQRGFVYIKLLVDGLAAPAFSAQTLPPRDLATTIRQQVIEHSRLCYTKSRTETESIIDETAGFRQRREAEAATKAAAAILEKGQNLQRGKPNTPLPKVQAQSTVQTVPELHNELTVVQSPSVPATLPDVVVVDKTIPNRIIESSQSTQGRGEVRSEKPVKTMDGWVYRETSQKGGAKWYLAEPEADMIERKRAKLAAKSESPTPLSTSEQTTNVDSP